LSTGIQIGITNILALSTVVPYLAFVGTVLADGIADFTIVAGITVLAKTRPQCVGPCNRLDSLDVVYGVSTVFTRRILTIVAVERYVVTVTFSAHNFCTVLTRVDDNIYVFTQFVRELANIDRKTDADDHINKNIPYCH